MPASTRVRAAIVVAAVGGTAAGYAWWNGSERQIHRLLSEIASTLSHESSETELRALASVASLQRHLAPDVSIGGGESSRLVRGRQEVLSMAARLRVSSTMMRVQFFDAEIEFTDEMSATTRVTVQVTTRDRSGAEVADAYLARIALVRAEGRWMVSRALLLRGRDASL